MRKRFLQKSVLVITALLLAAGLLLGQNTSASAEEMPPSETGIAAEESTTITETEAEKAEHITFSSEMLAAAKDRFGLNRRMQLFNALPSPADSGKILESASLPYTGNAKVIAFHVTFQDQKFEDGDTEDALQKAIGVDTAGNTYAPLFNNQYGSLSGYYQRASYGKLSIAGDTYVYDAQKAKEDYEDSTELCRELLDAMNATIDFSKYDANADGLIDCLYLHIPYDSSDKWSSTWWPNCGNLIDEENMTYDGVHAASRVILSRKINTDDGVRTLIHESGHAMGFPDYYSFDKTPDPTGGANQLTGILTFDMMDTNTGDHNGFSKWIAGWLTNADVTLVNANENGVVATRNGQAVGTVNEDGSVTLNLESFDSDEISKTGGIIVVGNNVQNAFGNYFLIQYDTFAGNQQVYYGENKPLPSGFRVYRVQAELDEYGQLKRNNTHYPLYDKLIELVDPDYKAEHTTLNDPYVPTGFAAETYNCMFYGGSSLTPLTGPSTNFREDISIGFTGISIDFLESGTNSGTLKISYSEEHKPTVEELDVKLTEGVAAPGVFEVTLKGNRNLLFGVFGSQGISASIKEGEDFLVTDSLRAPNYDLDGDTITAKFHFDIDTLKPGRTVVVRCREGAFDIGKEGEWSKPFEFEIPITTDMTEIAESGYIEDTVVENKGQALTPVQRAKDGSYFFYGYVASFLPTSSTDIYKYTFTGENPTNVTRELLTSGSTERTEAVDYINNIYQIPATEGASSLPENAELGRYTEVLDAVQIGDYYYAASFRKYDYTDPEPNRMAISKFDAEGNLIEQIFPAGNEIKQEPGSSSRVRILVGPAEKIAVTLFEPFQDRIALYLTGNMATFFLDQDLKLVSRLNNYSSGCGTWLEDGSYITFGQRILPTSESNESDFPRTNMICYDLTTVIDPLQYKAESETGEKTPVWVYGEEEDLLFVAHRNVDDDTAFEHFTGVQVDGNNLSDKDYTATPGSVHIALHPEYLATLSEGTHTLSVLFDDGKADVNFTIQKEKADPDDKKTDPDDKKSDTTPDNKKADQAPDTGDHNQPVIWIIVMAAAVCIILAAVIVVFVRRRKK